MPETPPTPPAQPMIGRRYEIIVVGPEDQDQPPIHRALRAFFAGRGQRVVSSVRGLVCAACHGRGYLLEQEQGGCLVLPWRQPPCPANCDEGRPTEAMKDAARAAGEL